MAWLFLYASKYNSYSYGKLSFKDSQFTYQQVSRRSALCRAVFQDGFASSCLSCRISCSTTPGVMCTSSACHPHVDVIHTQMSSAHAHHLHAHVVHMSSTPACHLHTHMSSTHHLQHSSWSAWT